MSSPGGSALPSSAVTRSHTPAAETSTQDKTAEEEQAAAEEELPEKVGRARLEDSA
jgi:hypothetical protein